MIGSNERARRRRTEATIVFCISVAATAGYAVYAGQDTNWDQRNYHIYSVYAWLHGETFTEFAPAQIQTWLNPLPHLPQYLLIRHAPPLLAGASMGAIAGINGLLLWLLIRRLQGHDSSTAALIAASLVVAVGLTGSLFRSFLGTTFAEYLCSPLILASLICLTKSGAREVGTRRFAVAGLCLGAACGLKLTNLIFAVGMSATLLLLWPFVRFRFGPLASYAAGGLAGAALAGGYWASKLWITLGNPMFPFFNALFRSYWFAPVNFTDARFLPPSFVKAVVVYPFAWLIGLHPTSELPFREPRFAFVAVILPLVMVVTFVRGRRPHPDRDRTMGAVESWNFRFCVLFFVVSFAIWLGQFGIQRYALPLELLTGVLVFLSLGRLSRTAWHRVGGLAVVTVLAVAWTRPPDWTRIPYGESWFGLDASAHPPYPMLYVMVGGAPMAYAIALLPIEDRFVRIGGNLRLEPETPLGQRALEIIRAHRGPLMTMAAGPLRERDRVQLERFGLSQTGEPCTTLITRQDRLLTCGVTLTKPKGAAQ